MSRIWSRRSGRRFLAGGRLGVAAGMTSGRRASAARDLGPPHIPVDADVAGEPQDPLPEDVAHDLRSPTLDGVGARPEEGLGDLVVAFTDAGGTNHLVARDQKAFGPQEIDTQFVDLLCQLTARQLADRLFGPGCAARPLLLGPHSREAHELGFDPEVDDAISRGRVGITALLPQLDCSPDHAAAPGGR